MQLNQFVYNFAASQDDSATTIDDETRNVDVWRAFVGGATNISQASILTTNTPSTLPITAVYRDERP